MTQIKQHTLQSGERILMVNLPSDANTLSCFNSKLLYYSKQHISDDNKFGYDILDLPEGNYQILCLAKDATEEQAAIVVDNGDAYPNEDRYKHGYAIYSDNNELLNYYDDFTALESLTSLLTSLGFKQDDNVLILEKI